MHFVLSSKGVGLGAGQWGLEPATLKSIRNRIVDEADGAALIEALDQAATLRCRMGEPDLARSPKGFDAHGRRGELLRYKAVVARIHEDPFPKSRIIGAGAEDWVMEATTTLMPLIRWLNA